MKISFIRHGMTAGNAEKRYIGRTDEPLCENGIGIIKSKRYPECDIVISSPMRRCIETAKLIYPAKEIKVYENFRECDFGGFEGKNYIDLNGDEYYQKWIDSGGKLAFPGGESPLDFRRRCLAEFERMLEEIPEYRNISLIVHGGTIMSVLEKYAQPHKDFYDWQVKNGSGWKTEFDGEKLIILEKI